MNSSEWQDREIDELFQSSAQAFEAPAFDPAAWELMDQKLNAFASLQAWYQGILGGTLTVLLALLLFAGFQYPTNDSMAAISSSSENIAEALVESEPLLEETQPVEPNAEQVPPVVAEKEAEIEDHALPQQNSALPVIINQEEKKGNLSTPERLTEKPTFSMAFAPPLASGNKEDIQFEDPKPLSLEPVPETEPEEIIPQKSSFSRWGIGALYAPDLSSVGLKNFTSPGTNLGVTVEYQISPRFSVSTGLIYGIKKYDTEGDEYTVPPGFWDGNPAPDLINAQCDVIDIPINISYRIYQGPKSVFSVSTGLSSYFMLSEDYAYEGNYYYPDNSFSVENENQHFFGIYNISIAYARPLNEQLYLQVEPFMKVPIAEIGFGEVDLNSTGVMFSLRYWLKNKR